MLSRHVECRCRLRLRLRLRLYTSEFGIATAFQHAIASQMSESKRRNHASDQTRLHPGHPARRSAHTGSQGTHGLKLITPTQFKQSIEQTSARAQTAEAGRYPLAWSAVKVACRAEADEERSVFLRVASTSNNNFRCRAACELQKTAAWHGASEVWKLPTPLSRRCLRVLRAHSASVANFGRTKFDASAGGLQQSKETPIDD